MLLFVNSLKKELLKEKRYSNVLAMLTDYRGPLVHYPIYFKLLLRCVLAIHDTELGWDVIKLLFPNLTLNDSPLARTWFILNRQAIKYYKSVNNTLVDSSDKT